MSGTIIRTADAAWFFDGVFISRLSAVIYNLKTLRVCRESFSPASLSDGYSYFIRSWLVLPLLNSSVDLVVNIYRLQKVDSKRKALLIMGNEGRELVRNDGRQLFLVHISMKGQAESA